MQKFKTVADVKKAFLGRSGGTGRIKGMKTDVRLEDIDKHAHILERVLQSDYNKICGYGFSEVMEAVSYISSNYDDRDYVDTAFQNMRATEVSESAIQAEMIKNGSDYTDVVSEAFEGTTISQSPFPVPSVGMTMYHYERAVLPFLAHIFDLKGNRGYIYFQKLTAMNAKGNIAKGDLLASPKDLGKQPVGFVGTKAFNENLVEAGLVTGTTSYTGTLKDTPVMPGTLFITVSGQEGYFRDYANAGSREAGVVNLVSVNGNLGTATVNYATGEVTVELNEAPVAGGEGTGIFANYDRDIQTVAGGTENLAEVTMELDSKHLVAEDFGVKSDTNVQQQALARAVFGLDWNEALDNMLVQLWNKEIANKVVTEIRDAVIGMGDSANATHDISAGITGGGNNALFNTLFINVVLGKLTQLIAQNSGQQTHKVSTIVIAQNVVPIIRALEKFKPANGLEDNMGGFALIGTYDGVPVLAGFAPIVADGDVIGLYRNNRYDFLAPYAFGMFIAPFIRDIFDNNNLAVNRKQLIASGAGTVCAEKLASRIVIENIGQII